MKTTFTVAAVVAVACLLAASLAFGQDDGLTLTLVSGTHTNTYTDSGSGMINVPFGTAVGTWSIDSLTIYSQPAIGDSTDDYVYVYGGSLENNSGSAPLVIKATETGFTAFSTANATFDMTLQDYAEVTATSTGQINSTTIGNLAIAAPAGTAATSSTVINNSAVTSPFNMTETVVINGSAGSTEASGPVNAEL